MLYAGSCIQAGVRQFVPIKAGGFYARFYGIIVLYNRAMCLVGWDVFCRDLSVRCRCTTTY